MPASNFFGAITQGLNFAEQQEQQKLQRQQQLMALDDRRKAAIFQDARSVNSFLKAGQPERALGVLSDRMSQIEQLGGDPRDTKEVADLILQGDFKGAVSLLDSVEQAGVGAGFLKDLSVKKDTSFAPSDAEKKEKRLNALMSELEVAKKSGDKKSINAATQRLNNFEKLAGLTEESAQTKADIAVDKANKIELAKLASKASSEAFDGLKNVRSTILNMEDAIKALDKGAETGPIISKLPSFRAAAIELDNIKNKMGLDVVGATTFGALSESELAFALDTALPTNLEPKELNLWLKRKIKSQRALGKGLRDAASFLGKPGNTIADYIEKQELKTKEMNNRSGLTPEEEEELAQLEAEFGGQ